jgi:hypothetical protein
MLQLPPFKHTAQRQAEPQRAAGVSLSHTAAPKSVVIAVIPGIKTGIVELIQLSFFTFLHHY